MSEQRTRDRVLEAGMRLFAAKGYAGTSVAEIEATAGLSPGSGSLYRHFPSKRALLEAGVQRRIDEGRQLLGSLSGLPPEAPDDLGGEAMAIVVAALRRLDASGDLNRMMVKDLNQFPELMDRVRVQELAPIYAAVAGWISSRSEGAARAARGRDPAAPGHSEPRHSEQSHSDQRHLDQSHSDQRDNLALAAVLVGATSHFWLLRDGFGEHPAGLSEERFVRAMAQVAEALLGRPS